jgi:hypothetical protein
VPTSRTFFRGSASDGRILSGRVAHFYVTAERRAVECSATNESGEVMTGRSGSTSGWTELFGSKADGNLHGVCGLHLSLIIRSPAKVSTVLSHWKYQVRVCSLPIPDIREAVAMISSSVEGPVLQDAWSQGCK